MRIVVHGQQAFGKAVLEALLKRGENVVAVYVAPEKEGAKADPLKEAAVAAGLKVMQPASYKSPEVLAEFKALKPDLQVMAFVTLFVPEEFLNAPTHGSIQYHPSLLPAYRGASAINWPIIKGEKETGLSIFWPDNGLDTGDVLLQKKTPISGTDTLGTVYFDRLFPMGVDAMMESVDLVKAGKAPRIKQDESLATYEGRCGPGNAKIDWGKPWEQIDRLQSGARRLVHARRQDAEDFRRQASAGQGSEGHCRQARRNSRGRGRGLYGRLRRRPLQGHPRTAGRRQEDRSRRMGEVGKYRRGYQAHMN
jgi:methionyl-tRNA formyltransferase